MTNEQAALIAAAILWTGTAPSSEQARKMLELADELGEWLGYE